jgi:excisionase family DNA binding protein
MSDDQARLDYRPPEWVAEQLGIDKNTVYKYLQEGSLPGLQLGRKWLVSERRLAEFLERVEREQTQRRQTGAGRPRPFALPPRQLLHDTDDERR